MNKTCGTCGKCRNTHDGPYCFKGGSPKPVSPLRVMDCWVDPDEVEKEPQATKVCGKCGRELPVTSFGRHSRTKDGYQPYCKECLSKQNSGKGKRKPFEHNEAPEKAPDLTAEQMGIGKGRRSTHPSYVDKDTGVTMKWCVDCHQYKPIDEFHHNKANKDGHEFNCKACRAARSAESRRKKAEEKKAREEEKKGLSPVPEEPAPEKKKGVLIIETPDQIKFREWAETHIGPKTPLSDIPIDTIVKELRCRGVSGQLIINL